MIRDDGSRATGARATGWRTRARRRGVQLLGDLVGQHVDLLNQRPQRRRCCQDGVAYVPGHAGLQRLTPVPDSAAGGSSSPRRGGAAPRCASSDRGSRDSVDNRPACGQESQPTPTAPPPAAARRASRWRELMRIAEDRARWSTGRGMRAQSRVGWSGRCSPRPARCRRLRGGRSNQVRRSPCGGLRPPRLEKKNPGAARTRTAQRSGGTAVRR